MKRLLGLVLILGWVGSVWAQGFQASFSTLEDDGVTFAPVDSICGDSTHPVADGTDVEIWWDRGPSGPSPEDTLAPIGQFNFNAFQFNGESNVGEPSGRGNFFTDYFGTYNEFPRPCRFYVRICLPQRYYYSSSETFISGEVSDVLFGRDDWFCQNTECPDMSLDASTPSGDLIPAGFSLQQNYPNPFNPSTQICYALLRAGAVSLTVSDVLGRSVTTLVAETQAAGVHTVSFDGAALPSGVYFYRLQSGDFVQMKKMVLMK